jgi:erythromycin esterase-like protein
MNSTDTYILAAVVLDPEALVLLAANLDHLAQLVDDPGQAAEVYRTAAALRTLAGFI